MQNKIGKLLLIISAVGLVGIVLLNWISDDESGWYIFGLLIFGGAILGPLTGLGGLLRNSKQNEHSKIGWILWRTLLVFVLAGGIYLLLVITGTITPLG